MNGRITMKTDTFRRPNQILKIHVIVVMETHVQVVNTTMAIVLFRMLQMTKALDDMQVSRFPFPSQTKDAFLQGKKRLFILSESFQTDANMTKNASIPIRLNTSLSESGWWDDENLTCEMREMVSEAPADAQLDRRYIDNWIRGLGNDIFGNSPQSTSFGVKLGVFLGRWEDIIAQCTVVTRTATLSEQTHRSLNHTA